MIAATDEAAGGSAGGSAGWSAGGSAMGSTETTRRRKRKRPMARPTATNTDGWRRRLGLSGKSALGLSRRRSLVRAPGLTALRRRERLTSAKETPSSSNPAKTPHVMPTAVPGSVRRAFEVAMASSPSTLAAALMLLASAAAAGVSKGNGDGDG